LEFSFPVKHGEKWQGFGKHPARIVAGMLIFSARISEKDDKL
jgi:hypothetical protein